MICCPCSSEMFPSCMLVKKKHIWPVVHGAPSFLPWTKMAVGWIIFIWVKKSQHQYLLDFFKSKKDNNMRNTYWAYFMQRFNHLVEMLSSIKCSWMLAASLCCVSLIRRNAGTTFDLTCSNLVSSEILHQPSVFVSDFHGNLPPHLIFLICELCRGLTKSNLLIHPSCTSLAVGGNPRRHNLETPHRNAQVAAP